MEIGDVSMEIKNLDHYQRDLTTYYGGKSGSKYAIIIDGQRWMIKFPENTKNFPGRKKKMLIFHPTQ